MMEAPGLVRKGGASKNEELCEERDVRVWGESKARKGGLGIDRELGRRQGRCEWWWSEVGVVGG